jgi:ABC-type nitrate/sulfonate/bicarbonate transport system substrate-binding protein
MNQLARGVAVFSALALALTGCGTSAEKLGANGELTVIVASPNPTITGTIALGIAEGTFEGAGVKVHLEVGEGAQAVNAMVAGRADLTEASAASAGSLEAQGKDISAIWASSGGGMGLKLFTSAGGPTTVAEFQDQLAGQCSAGVTAPGSSGYGYMALFNDELGLDCRLVELADTAQILSALISGRVDTMLSSASEPAVATAVGSEQVNIILDTASGEVTELGLPQFPDRVIFGLSSNLDNKRADVEAFTEGMQRAAVLYQSMDVQEIQAAMLSIESIGAEFPTAEDRAGLTKAITDSKPFVNWTHGYIAESDWNSFLNAAANWDIDGFDHTDPKQGYASVVDMSYYGNPE